ncbi:Microcystin-dependent protein [Chitinophaga sp. CF118]|uniref:phage tail protein n=1 Tax=Chitinophaga sp. CF118 TaxID=1884367 RepID=UPI0008E7FE30|nr:tail fiber protein [Chitinophaga sp. CF118]SFD15513.1 Microcystin-dependent protein [Chitinophaga sp. CF118]
MDGFIGEIRALGFNFTPVGWLACDGSTYSINSFQALFAIIGIQFGGNGTTNFKVPDLRGIVLTGVNPAISGFDTPGENGGSEEVALVTSTMPAHNHNIQAVTRTSLQQTTVATAQPAANVYLSNAFSSGLSQGIVVYSDTLNNGTILNQQSIGLTGGSTPHQNMSPYLALTYSICVEGIFPPHS